MSSLNKFERSKVIQILNLGSLVYVTIPEPLFPLIDIAIEVAKPQALEILRQPISLTDKQERLNMLGDLICEGVDRQLNSSPSIPAEFIPGRYPVIGVASEGTQLLLGILAAQLASGDLNLEASKIPYFSLGIFPTIAKIKTVDLACLVEAYFPFFTKLRQQIPSEWKDSLDQFLLGNQIDWDPFIQRYQYHSP